MGMIAFRLTLLFCSLTLCNLGESASVLDNSSDLLKNWLLKEDEEPPSQQSPPLSRRITPKSIFVVPVFENCRHGHHPDGKGGCLKTVPVNDDPNMGVLLQKLKAFFPSPATGAKDTAMHDNSKVDSKATPEHVDIKNIESSDKGAEVSVGPLQLSIPIGSKNSSESGQEQTATPVTTRQSTFTLKNRISIGSTTAATVATESTNEFTTYEYNAEGSTVGLLELAASTAFPEAYTSETSTELPETTTIVDTVPTELAITEMPTRLPPFGHSVRNPAISDASRTTMAAVRRDETTTVDTVYPLPGGDILKTPVRFPDSFGGSKTDAAISQGGIRVAASEFTNAYAKTTYVRETSAKNGYGNGATNDGFRITNINNNNNNNNNNNDSENRDSKVSYSASINSNSENSDSRSGSITNFKDDKHQKLPPGGREGAKPDTYAPEKRPPYSLFRNPMTTYIRFPGSYPKIRFPEGRKPSSADGHVDDVVSYAETNVAGTRYWDGNRYPTSYWTSWDSSKPHLVQIWPGDALVAYNAARMNSNNYNSRSQPISYS